MNPSDAILARWELVETIGWLAVIFGCFGEGIAEFTKYPKDETRRHRIGKVSWLILIVGLALEFWGSGKISHIKDERVAKLNLRASQADERAALTASNNLVLRSNLWVLQQSGPEKQPVFSASAFLKFTINSTNFVKAEALGSSASRLSAGIVPLTRRGDMDSIATLTLSGESLAQFGNDITIDLDWWPHSRRLGGTNRNETCEQLISELNRGIFSGFIFRERFTVTNARLVLILNGVVRKEFTLGRENTPPEGFPGVMFSLVEASSHTSNPR